MKRLLTGLMSLLPAHQTGSLADFERRLLKGWFDDVVVTPYLFVRDYGEFDPLPSHLCNYAFYVEVRAVPWFGRPVAWKVQIKGSVRFGFVDELPDSQELVRQTFEVAQGAGRQFTRKGFRSKVNPLEQRGGVMDYVWSLNRKALT